MATLLSGSITHYQNAVEALDMLGRRLTIRNKLNTVRSRTLDPTLKGLVDDLIKKFDETDANTEHTSIMSRRACNAAASALKEYCDSMIKQLVKQQPT